MHVLLILSIFQQFLSNLSLFFLYELLFESFLSIFESDPLLEIWRLSISVLRSSTATAILLSDQTASGAINNGALVCKALEQYL